MAKTQVLSKAAADGYDSDFGIVSFTAAVTEYSFAPVGSGGEETKFILAADDARRLGETLVRFADECAAARREPA